MYTFCTFPMHSKCSTHVILPDLIIWILNDCNHEAPPDMFSTLSCHFFHSLVHIISRLHRSLTPPTYILASWNDIKPTGNLLSIFPWTLLPPASWPMMSHPRRLQSSQPLLYNKFSTLSPSLSIKDAGCVLLSYTKSLETLTIHKLNITTLCLISCDVSQLML